MNKFTVIISNCHDCEYCDHNGLIQNKPKYVCHHKDVRERNKVDAKYWYEFPIIGLVNRENGRQLDIPDWCPRLEQHE